MKKFYVFLILFFAVSFAFGQNQNSDISSAIPLPAGNFESDYYFNSANAEMWFSFVADKDRMTFSLMHSASYSPDQNIEIDSVVLYSSGGSLIASAHSPNATSDTLPAIQILNLVQGNTYYLKLTKFKIADAGFFNLSKIILHSSVIPSPCTPCAMGANLICNGDFEILPSWAVGNCYADSSLTFPNSSPLPATIGYCTSSPNMRNDAACYFGNEEDYTDVYVISNYMGGQFQNTAEHGTHFMGIDCPSGVCVPCSLTNNPPDIWTPSYRAIAWQQNVPISNGTGYEFSCWLEALDAYPGATVSIVINTDTLFSDIISSGNGYGSWKQIEFCWTSNSSFAKIQILGKGAASYYGYDFGLDNITFTSSTTISFANVVTNVACHGINTGAATISVSGGILPYTYSWSPGGGTTSSETGLSAGVYTVSITDFGGCEINNIITITQPNVLSVSANITHTISCNGGGNGGVSSTVNGGTSPFTYLWSNSQTTSTISALSAGTYTLNISDSCGGSATASVIITQPNALALSITRTNVSCNGGSNGIISSTVSGGIMPYTYLWSDSKTTATISSLSAGTYTLNVTDHNGCTATASATITQPNILTVAATVAANISCNGGSNGSASSSVIGGTTPYTYLWSGGGGTSSTASGLTAGTYTLTVKDNNGCTATASVAITQPTILNVSIHAINVNCNGGSNGNATAIVNGGTPSYTYTWSGGGGTNSTVIGLSAGTYTVFVQDSCGALARASVTITQPAFFTASATINANIICHGDNNGSATVTATGGTSPYTYLWTPSGQTTSTATGLSALIYSILVTDANGCTTSTNVVITQPLAIRVTPSVLSNITCNGNNTGSITAAVGGGTSPYLYLWSGGRGTTHTIYNLSAGTYTVTVTDNNGCTGTASASITEPDTLSVSAHATGVSCYGENSGSASSIVSGGTLPYTYSWSNGQTTANASHLIARTYTLTVQDSCGDVEVTTVLITQPPAISITEGSIPDPGNCIGSAWVNVSGGTPAYTYFWSPGGNTTDSVYHQCPGSYCCTVTDAHGCTDSVCLTITSTAGIDNITSGSGQITIYPNPNNGQFTIEASGISGKLFVEIYNVLGQEVRNEELKENTTVINLNSQPNEIYLYRVLKESGQLVGEGKIIISR